MNQKIIFIFVVGIIGGVNAVADCGPNGDQNCEMRCQDESFGGVLPVASVCADVRTDCGLLFNCSLDTATCEADPAKPAANATPGDAATYPKVRAAACDNPGSQDLAMQCAKTCLICCETPEYNCDDDDTGIVDCQANIGKCKDANWTDIMAQYCPASCGLCLAGSCSDINAGCNGMATLCRDIDWYDYMGTNCARTCDRCTTTNSTTNSTSTTASSCADIANNCATNAALCTNSVYRTLMSQQCCRTCSSSSGGSTCTDANPSCSTWVGNGFCTSTFYTAAQKRQYCAGSCNLC